MAETDVAKAIISDLTNRQDVYSVDTKEVDSATGQEETT